MRQAFHQTEKGPSGPFGVEMTDLELIDCPLNDCQYKTNLLRGEDAMMHLMEMHMAANHPVNGGGGSAPKATGREKVKRPALALDIIEDDWSYWLSRWDDYKVSTVLKTTEVMVEVRECLEESLRRERHRRHPGQF